MGRPKNDDVWACFTKTAAQGVECKYCKKKYAFANVNKMESHLLACFKCPEEMRAKVRDHVAKSKFNQTSQSGSSSSTESDGAGRSSSTSFPSSSKIARKGLYGFVDNMSVGENVSLGHLNIINQSPHIHCACALNL